MPGAGLVAQISAAEARQSEQRRGPSNNTESPLLRDTIGFRNFNIDAVTITLYSLKVPLSPSLLEPSIESIPSLCRHYYKQASKHVASTIDVKIVEP